MITKLEAATVREEYFTKKRSIRCIARWHGLSRNTVRRYLREEDRKPYPLSEAGAFLKEQEIGELYAKCELRCPPTDSKSVRPRNLAAHAGAVLPTDA